MMYTLEKAIELTQLGAFAIFGGIAKQCHRMLRGGEKFSMWRLFWQLVLAMFAGVTAGYFIPHDLVYRDGIILMIGYTAHPLLDMLEIKFLNKAGSVIN